MQEKFYMLTSQPEKQELEPLSVNRWLKATLAA